MCSNFLKRMDNYQGDLADIFRATTSRARTDGADSSAEASAAADWQFSSNTSQFSYDGDEEYFGDPFAYMMRDPIVQNMDSPAPDFFCNSSTVVNIGVEQSENNCSVNLAQKAVDDRDEMRRPSNIFSRMLQISPCAKLPLSHGDSQAAAAAVAVAASPPRGLKGSPLLVPNTRNLVESPLQISSPRNTGNKRRKSQAKKVVCIPAPAPANSRATGEVVPSDLWAWRKYGQKPIRGSPFPRGYYRCSSSKGCSARKQVERSRTDPNMLVITYTSEHNHPWPTQRNALAGSTRSQPSKNVRNAAKNSLPNSQTQKPTNPKQEKKEMISIENAAVKEERDQDFDHQLKMDEAEFDEGFPQTYKPMFPESAHPEDSFFADLGEIEADPLDLLFAQGFSGDPGQGNNDLDSFSFYDRETNNSNTTASTTTTATTTVSSATSYAVSSNKDF